MLHKIPEYLLRTDSEGCAERVNFMGPQLAGLRELWELMAGFNSAGTQTLLHRMAIQLRELERSGCVRLDQVWNIPTAEAQQTAMDMAITKFRRDLRVTSGEWVEKVDRLREQVQKALAQNQEFYHKRHARKERSPSADSTEIVEVAPWEKGKEVVGKRESKRAKAEVVETPEVETPPDLMEVNPKAWQENKKREGTYRYNYSAWKDVKPPHNPWLVRGNRAGLYMAQGPLWVRVPQVVETCRKVYGGTASSSKIQAFELYVPLPGGKVHKCLHEGHVGPVLRRRDVCHVHGRRSSKEGRPRAAPAKQAKGPGCRHQEGRCPAGPGSPGRRDALGGHLRTSWARDGNPVAVSVPLARADAHSGAYPGSTIPC
jgi:hypothetical protein